MKRYKFERLVAERTLVFHCDANDDAEAKRKADAFFKRYTDGLPPSGLQTSRVMTGIGPLPVRDR